jgi:hypothetical protein
MKKRKRTGIAVLALIGMLIGSGIALADPLETEEEPTDSEVLADTLFSFGYDLINGLLLWNISSVDEPCTLPTGDGAEPEPETEPEPEIGPECELTSGEVAGPNGQVNHGMFIKLFNSLYDGNARGCVIRHLAQSDLGQGDQQVKVGDEVDETEDTDDTAPIDFTTVEADCEKGGDDTGLEAGNGNGNGNGNGKSANAGKPESPGKSASAPGKNK